MPAGRYGSTVGLSSSQCTGKRMRLRQRLIMCACGHGQASCRELLPVRFPSQPLFHNAGPCDAGRYGTEGQTSSTCTGTCSAGYACPAGSTSATQVICPAGQHSPVGASACSACAAGKFSGSAAGTSSSTCAAHAAAQHKAAQLESDVSRHRRLITSKCNSWSESWMYHGKDVQWGHEGDYER
jgi:hypothetical protein